ncbi:MAG: hypothetical protein EOP06_24355, partial [Proteobacteria bacterium]
MFRGISSYILATFVAIALACSFAHAGGVAFGSPTPPGDGAKPLPIAASPNEADEFIRFETGYYSKVARTRIYPAEKCKEILQAFSAPEAIIKDGLKALTEGPLVPTDLACINDLSQNWRENYNQGEILDSDLDALQVRKMRHDEELSKLRSRMKCTNPHLEGSVDFGKYKSEYEWLCESKWQSTEALPSLKTEAATLEAKIKDLTVKIRAEQDFRNTLPGLVIEEPKLDTAPLVAIRKRMECANQIEALPPSCNGVKITKEETMKLANEYYALEKELQQPINEARKRQGILREVLASQDPPLMLPRA